MKISVLSLQSYRSYINQTFDFSPQLTIVVARNASGKTNLLEAIYVLAVGQSFRSATIDDLIQAGKEYSRIAGLVTKDQEENRLEMILTHGVVQGKRSLKKIYSINTVKKTVRSMVGQLPIVSFIPEDLRLITGSPNRRRAFLDEVLSQIDSEYVNSLSTYTQSLRRRNKLLESIKEGQNTRAVLSFWDQSVLKHGQYLQKARRSLIDQFNLTEFPHSFYIEYVPSVISEERLQKYAQAEVAVGHTLVGPHKDDITVKFQISNIKIQKNLNEQNHSTPPLRSTPHNLSPITHYPLSTHGSRGQQRLGVLWLKLGQYQLLKNQYSTPPLLLLDDIFSELDVDNRKHVLDLTKQSQTILTTAETEVLAIPELKNAKVIRL